MDPFAIFFILCMAISGSGSRTYATTSPPAISNFDVTTYGAVGNGEEDDSNVNTSASAFLKAWEAVCRAESSNPILVIPEWKTFLLKPVVFHGPCISPHINVQVGGNIVAPTQQSAWPPNNNDETWIVFYNVNGLSVNGKGQIDGQGSEWWESCNVLGRNNCTRPTALTFYGCNNLEVSGLNHINSQRNHISIINCNNVVLSRLNIIAPEQSPNTDGIDTSMSTNVTIQDCQIGTGDDCIAISTGSTYINITGVTCGPGHGISVGSLGYHGERSTVEEVLVKNCTFNKTLSGARIKTWQGGSGYARKIAFEDIILIAARYPIIIDQFYCDRNETCLYENTSAVNVSDVSYTRFEGTSSNEVAIKFACSEIIGCTNISVSEINISLAAAGQINKITTSYCLNAHGTSTASIPDVNCLGK